MPISQLDRRRLRAYFEPEPVQWPYIGIAVAVGVILLTGGTSLTAWAAAIVIAGTSYYFLRSNPLEMSDKKVDAIIYADFSDIETRALRLVGAHNRMPDEFIRPATVLHHFADPEQKGDAFLGSRLGKDGILRFTPIAVTVINYTRDQILAYQSAVDLMTGNRINESTVEVFYQDIVSLGTQRKTRTIDIGRNNKPGLLEEFIDWIRTVRKSSSSSSSLKLGNTIQYNEYESFSMRFTNGQAFSITLRDGQLLSKSDADNWMPTRESEQAIAAIRNLLQEKKQSLLQR